MFSILTLALLIHKASAICDVCPLDAVHGREVKQVSSPHGNLDEYPHCKYYQDNACCSAEVVQNLIGLYGLDDWGVDKCGRDPKAKKMSKACYDYFVNEACFYECDLHVGKYRKFENCTENGWQIANMPIKASFCDAWLEACADDLFCSCIDEDNCDNPVSLFAISDVKQKCNLKSGRCKTFAETFKSGKELCEDMWAGSFLYETNEEAAYVMFWDQGEPNPNDEVNLHIPLPEPCPNANYDPRDKRCPADQPAHPVITPHTCHACQVRNVFATKSLGETKLASTPEADLGQCSAWNANSCCTPQVAKEVVSGKLYGDKIRWDRCYDNSAKKPSKLCSRWFVAESCLYHCDVNVGKYRASDKCEAEVAGTRIVDMPIKASDCDQFYKDCREELFCSCAEGECKNLKSGKPRSLFALGELECGKDNCKTFGDLFKDGKDLCEALYDGSYKYTRHEPGAYSFNVLGDKKNKNSLVNTHLPFKKNCPGFEANEEDICLAQSLQADATVLTAESVDNDEAANDPNAAPAVASFATLAGVAACAALVV